MDNIEYLTIEDIIQCHKDGFYAFGGSTYHVDYPCVEKRFVEVQTSYYGEEQYPGLFKKAAVYFHHISSIHCFVDGNKRAAVISTDLFMKLNGYKFKLSQKELYDYACIVANDKTRPPVEDVEDWIKEHVVPFDFEELSDYL